MTVLLGLESAAWVPYLLHLLGVPDVTGQLAILSPQMRKVRTFEALHHLYLRASQHQPLLLVIENLHWIDATSEEYLSALVERLSGIPLFLLLMTRPGYRVPRSEKSYAMQIARQPLDPHDGRQVIHAILDHTVRGAAIVHQILAKAQGNPFFYVFNPGVACRVCAACTLWMLGYSEQALERSQEALALAQALPHPSYSLATALYFAVVFHQFRQERHAVQERAEEVMTLSTDQGFPHWVEIGKILRGGALVETSPDPMADPRHGVEGITQLQQGLIAGQDIGVELGKPYFLALLAEAYGKGGQPEKGLCVGAEALTAINSSGECQWEATVST